MSDEPKFKVGDKVAVFNIIRHIFVMFDESSRMTPTGRIRLKGDPKADYNAKGQERSSSMIFYTYLKHDTPELRQEIADQKEEQELRHLPNSYPWRNLDLSQLRRLKALLDEFEKEKPK